MRKINLSETHINSYKTKDDIKFKLRQIELRYKNQLEYINDIKQNGYIGCVGLAGRF